MAWTLTQLNIADAGGTSRPLDFLTDATNFIAVHSLVDSTGAVINPAQASDIANTTNGASAYAALGGTGNALLTNAAVAVKASAGNLYGVSFVNTGNAAAYVQVFDLAAASVVLGTTVPKLSFYVPANGSWEEKFTGEAKVSFATAIAAAATATATGAGATNANILANIIYK